MNTRIVFVVLPLLVSPVWAQTDDMAAERARLANQRIEAEARARAKEEREARLAGEPEPDAVSQPAAEPVTVETRQVAAETPVTSAPAEPVAASPGKPPRPPVNVDRMLEQIRTLGELRDAGYVTGDEFERIKRRILDGEL